MKEYFFEKCGISYRTNEFDAHRSTLVFIHGLSGSASAWFPYEQFFGDTYNLLTFDLRGHGRSVRPQRYEDYVLRTCADDVYELLNYLHIEKCILISHSFGTLVALELVDAHPEKVSSLVFLSPTSYLRQTRWYSLVRVFSRFFVALCRIFPFHTLKRGRVDYKIFTYTADWDMRRIIHDISNTSIHSYIYCLMQAYASNHDDMWRHIIAPTLIVHGTNDGFIPVRNSKQLVKMIPTSHLVLLEGANHIIVLNNISEILELIRAFLQTL